jgi:anti-sigma regulatory factor (Ser/Thr protein kinase)
MTPDPGFYSRLDLACEESAIRYARSHAKDTLTGWGLLDEVIHDALTIVAELSSNAVRHAGGRTQPFGVVPGQPHVPACALLLWRTSSRLYVAMYDESPNPPVLRPASTTAESGRGVQLIDGLSGGVWGFERAAPGGGKTVWACLKTPPVQSQGFPALADQPGDASASPRSPSTLR